MNVAFIGLLMVIFVVPYRWLTRDRAAPAPAKVDRGIPTGLASLRVLSFLFLRLVVLGVLYGVVIALILGVVAAAILFPPLGAAIVIASIAGRIVSGKRKK